MVLSLRGISKSFGVTTIIEDATFILEDGEKAAIVGVNGAGKTTLFRIISGEHQPDGGEMSCKKGVSIGCLSQVSDLDEENTVYEELLTVFARVRAQEAEMKQLEMEMAGGDHSAETLERYSVLRHRFEDAQGYEYESRVRGVISGLGFSEGGSLFIKNLSGGQKTKVALGKLLLGSSDLLLLDEPTNHLDIESVNWLEDSFIKNFKKSMLIISHDRYFLDKTVTKIIEVENKRTRVYNGNYTYYAYRKEIDRELQLKQYLDQQKDIQRQEEIIKTFRARAHSSKKAVSRAESREKLLAKMDRLEKPADLPDKMRLVLEPNVVSGNDVLHVEGMSKSFRKPLFSNINFDIKKGEVVAIVGANGIGKTTLMKILNRRLSPDSGFFRLGTNVMPGYYDQEQFHMDESKSVFDELHDANPQMNAGVIRNVLAAFMFTNDEVFKPISALSGGERGRVSLCKIMLSSANFLMLDEPTNHLDMFSKEILENAIRSYTGTILYISHDRYFINNTADKVLEFTPNGMVTYMGNYDYYIEKRSEEQSAETAAEVSETKESRQIKKEKQSEERRRATQLERTEKEIAGLEARIAELEKLAQEPDVCTDAVRLQAVWEEREEKESALEELYERWGGLV